MTDINIAGVMRAGAFSPNHIGNDAAIFNLVLEQLRKRGCSVTTYSEEQFQNEDIPQRIILNMARERASIIKLQQLEDEGALVINSGYGIANCTREYMTRMLIAAGVPYPESLIVDTDQNIRPLLEEKGFGQCWVKRGESHSLHREDVAYCRHLEEAQEIVHEFFYRGIKRAVINRHLEGDLVKFYGVRNGKFFYYFYPFYGHREKYGFDAINGTPTEYKFDKASLLSYCEMACKVLDVDIYGGDCIVSSDGSFQIIDFNDWPSFAPCRKEAAPVIASYLLKKIKKYINDQKI
ncbi:MAG: hypothetical protein NC201_02020 [Prevotella sp.]|nr:hypothetical protein [Bacteroides sp.]MCM1366004.1 hypothetical protein [Prevotella sp.]MCM1436926.1 hypothetical protein [Prevotella sp.]